MIHLKKEVWLVSEIEKWKNEQIINDETAVMLKEKYVQKQSFNTLIVVFSIIGAILIGTGIILICAKNWENLPLQIRAIISIAPLFLSQLLSVFVLQKKTSSVAWRESAAILGTATMFSAIAMVGQTFHISGDFGNYLLICGILSLPLIYILDAFTPLLIYYYAILNWGALADKGVMFAAILTVLFIAGLFYVFLKRKDEGAEFFYMVYLSLASGFILCWILSYHLGGSVLLTLLAYFTLLFSAGSIFNKVELPFNIIATIGGVIILIILTFQSMWRYSEGINAISDIESLVYYAMISVMVLASLASAAKGFKNDPLKFGCIISVILICIMRFVWQIAELDFWPYEFIFMLITNAALAYVSIGLIVMGTRKTNLLIINWGLISACMLIILRFFDQDMDFFWRGIAFLVLGVLILSFNLKIIKMKKSRQEVQG